MLESVSEVFMEQMHMKTQPVMQTFSKHISVYYK